MRRSATKVAATALLLALAGLGAAGVAALARSDRPGGDPGRSRPAAECAPAAPALARVARAGELPVREELPCQRHEPAEPPAPAPDLARARTERQYRDAFLERERRSPGTLAAEAEERLDGHGPRAEKVGLLRALRASDAAGSVRWHEHAALTGSDPSLATFAVEELAELAAREEPARHALLRIALEGEDPTPALRRRAAIAFARTAGEAELDVLRPALARSDDELLVAGVLVALGEREESRAAARLVAEFGGPHDAARDVVAAE